jgi:hypothetical protein
MVVNMVVWRKDNDMRITTILFMLMISTNVFADVEQTESYRDNDRTVRDDRDNDRFITEYDYHLYADQNNLEFYQKQNVKRNLRVKPIGNTSGNRTTRQQ